MVILKSDFFFPIVVVSCFLFSKSSEWQGSSLVRIWVITLIVGVGYRYCSTHAWNLITNQIVCLKQPSCNPIGWQFSGEWIGNTESYYSGSVYWWWNPKLISSIWGKGENFVIRSKKSTMPCFSFKNSSKQLFCQIWSVFRSIRSWKSNWLYFTHSLNMLYTYWQIELSRKWCNVMFQKKTP